ncbi:hypothetical protein [Maribacter sp. 2307ULW6-5]|uniref:hypothetical protein n=1 Tax=Maribacter sp. 2307ULW6-5 TaxID=3386275 RepID=UPI0039BCCE68
MKHAILLVALCSSISFYGQGNGARGQGPHHDFSPEQMATLQTKKMTLALDLSAEQAAKIKTLFRERAKERMSKNQALKEKRATEEAKRPSSSERFQRANERLDREIAFQKQLGTILDGDQYEAWKKMRSREIGKKQKRWGLHKERRGDGKRHRG